MEEQAQCCLLSFMFDFEGEKTRSQCGLSLPTPRRRDLVRRGEDWCCSGSPCHIKHRPWAVTASVAFTVECQSSTSGPPPQHCWRFMWQTCVGRGCPVHYTSTVWSSIPGLHVLEAGSTSFPSSDDQNCLQMSPGGGGRRDKITLIPHPESHPSTDKFQRPKIRTSKHSEKMPAHF